MKQRLMSYLSKMMITCDEASYFISVRQEGRLGFSRWWRLQIHLLICHLCRRYARQIRQLDRALEHYRKHGSHDSCPHHLSPESAHHLEETIKRKLHVK